MHTIKCEAGKPYDIITGNGLIKDCGQLIRQYAANNADKAQRAIIVSETNVWPIYGDIVEQSLKLADFETGHICFKAGEEQKNMTTINELLTAFAQNNLTRKDIVIALGGGVTGDMAGFAASIWLRGINFIQIPTSLLAQVDSSVGGKTGVDCAFGKNLIGAFHQPSLVICDIDTLKTLPQEYFIDGMGEVVKYGCILDKELFEWLENDSVNDIMDKIINRCIQIKADVVKQDEFESGIRMYLNFGHTLGHAIERLNNFSGISHGCAVAIGMVYVTKAGEQLGITPEGSTKRLIDVCRKFDLPISQDKFSLEDICTACNTDKKRSGDSINLIMLNSIGQAFARKVKAVSLYEDILSFAE